MKTLGLGLVGALLCAGCSQGSPAAATAPPPTETATPTASAPVLPPTADDLLQARLRKAASEYDGYHGMRDPEEMGFIGLVGKPSGPGISGGASTVSGRRPPEVIQRKVRQNFGRFRLCYEDGLRRNPALKGKVSVTFVIKPDGRVGDAKATGDLPDKAVNECVRKAFASLSFDEGEAETRVTYPINFVPDDGAVGASPTKPSSDPLAAPSAPPAPSPPPSAPAASTPARRSPRPDGPWPIVAVEGTKVFVNGDLVGDTKALTDEGRLMRVDGVFNAMKAWRDDWMAKHPDADFIGIAGLRVEPGTPALVVKSVFQTIAFAGFPDVFVQSAAEPSVIHALAAQVPGPPIPVDPAERRELMRWVSVHLGESEATITWKRAATVVEEHKVATADLAAKICESWKRQGEHRQSDDPRADRAVVHLDNALAYAEVAGAIKAIESCTRPDARGASRAAFWVTFSVR